MILIKVDTHMPKFVNTQSMNEYNKFMDAFNNTDRVLIMTLEEYSPNVTDKQHSLFKALLVQGSMISGYSYKEFEDELIDNFAPYKYQESIIGGKIKIRKRVSEMNHKEFSTFIEQCIQFAAEFYDLKF